MELSLFYILGLGFLLGIKHAVEPDHVIAVSTIASQTKTLKRSVLAGIYWGIGHTLTLFIAGMFLIMGKDSISEGVALSLEFAVGIMLVYLGISSLAAFSKRRHSHIHQESTASGSPQLKSLVIGFIHGLAGSAAMVLLTMSTVSTVWEGALYILLFGFGTIVGMLSFSALIGIPFILSSERKLNHHLNTLAGVASTVFGVYYMYNLGINEGLFSIWF